MHASRSCLVVTSLLLSACAGVESTRETGSPAAAAATTAPARSEEADGAALAAKVAAAERALALARAKLDKSRTEVANQETVGRENVTAAAADCELGKRALANFDVTSKVRLEQGKLGLQGAIDSMAEAEEELQQLELMYEKTDLADKTKELVIRRSQRRLERSRKSLELQRQTLANLEAIDLVQERAKLQQDFDQKTRASARAARDAAMALLDKQLALQAQENEVVKLEEELVAARRAADKAAKDAR